MALGMLQPADVLIWNIRLTAMTSFDAPGTRSRTPLLPADVPIWNIVTRAEG